MQNIYTTPPDHIATVLGRIGKDPSRLMTISEWWHEMDEPVDMLDDPEATFAEEERLVLKLCLANDISYGPANGGRAAAFPAWLLKVFYPVLGC